jgi:hypothetical protein
MAWSLVLPDGLDELIPVFVLLKLIGLGAVHVVISDDDLHTFRYFDVLDDSAFNGDSDDLHGLVLLSRFKRVSRRNEGAAASPRLPHATTHYSGLKL